MGIKIRLPLAATISVVLMLAAIALASSAPARAAGPWDVALVSSDSNTLLIQNIVTNGDFEIPVVSWPHVTYSAGQTFSGWTVESGSIEQIAAGYWQAASGSQSVDLSGLSITAQSCQRQ